MRFYFVCVFCEKCEIVYFYCVRGKMSTETLNEDDDNFVELSNNNNNNHDLKSVRKPFVRVSLYFNDIIFMIAEWIFP